MKQYGWLISNQKNDSDGEAGSSLILLLPFGHFYGHCLAQEW